MSPDISKRKSFSSPQQQLRERHLIIDTAAGDENAFEQLYQLYFDRLYQFIFNIVRRQNCIDEIINDVMYVVWEKASTYDHTCRPSTWILGIAYYKALKGIEKYCKRDDVSVEFNDELDYFPNTGNNWVTQVEISNWLEAAFEQLSAEQRAVVELTYFQGFHYGEIADIMQCPENTIKTRMFHARKILAKSYQETNGRS